MYPRNPLRLPNDVLSRFTLRLPSSAIHLSNRSHSASSSSPSLSSSRSPRLRPSPLPSPSSSSPYSRIIRHRWKGKPPVYSTFRVLSSRKLRFLLLLVYLSFPFSFLCPVFSSSTTTYPPPPSRHQPHSYAPLFLERKTYADARAGIFMQRRKQKKQHRRNRPPFSPPPFRRLFPPLLLLLFFSVRFFSSLPPRL